MKWLIVLILALALLLSFAACGAAPADEETTPDEAASDEATEAEIKGLTDDERAKEFITVGTGPTSGIYFPIGGAFATALQDYGYQTSAEATNATGQNIADLKFHNIRPPVVGVKLHLIAEEAAKHEE